MVDGQGNLGDIPPEEFRRLGHQVVDWIADYLAGGEQYPVLSQLKPGDVRASLRDSAPDRPESLDAIFGDFRDIIVPGITHWNHPSFFAYFAITASAPGILAEMLAAALNVNAMLWRTSPAATELEEVSLSWLRQLLGLPDTFQGVTYDTASISTLVAIAAARQAADPEVRKRGLSSGPRLRLYCSEETHSSIEKDGSSK
jgi:aromatic-L-amino-acid decarboxylase